MRSLREHTRELWPSQPHIKLPRSPHVGLFKHTVEIAWPVLVGHRNSIAH